MCLYERKMENPHYLPNEKNGGVPPRATHKELTTISVGCGWCSECRKALAINWQIRLLEEYKDNKEAEFVTLHYSPEAIAKLEQDILTSNYKELNGTEIDVNILAAYSLRMFSERWRKKWKKAPRYWFTTELGHTSSERLHLHGIMWRTHEKCSKKEYQQLIIDKWQYGTVDIGQWVDERTISYITKYITKVDAKHEGYRPRTFVSKGLGAGYLQREGQYRNEYHGEETNTKYRMSNGTEYELPKYYKNKLYTTEQKEEIWLKKIEKKEIWLNGSKWDIQRSDEEEYRKMWKSALNAVRENNIRAGYNCNEAIPYKYIITEKMKVHFKDIEKTKCTQRVQRREIEESKMNEEIEPIAKTWDVKLQKYGIYIGTTTAGERKKNEEITAAKEKGVSVRVLRLIRKGVINDVE